jgi:hypothetical protein
MDRLLRIRTRLTGTFTIGTRRKELAISWPDGKHQGPFRKRNLKTLMTERPLLLLPAHPPAASTHRRDEQRGDPAALLATIGDAVPATLMLGRQDRIIRAEQAQAVPYAVRYVIEVADHMPHLERPRGADRHRRHIAKPPDRVHPAGKEPRDQPKYPFCRLHSSRDDYRVRLTPVRRGVNAHDHGPKQNAPNPARLGYRGSVPSSGDANDPQSCAARSPEPKYVHHGALMHHGNHRYLPPPQIMTAEPREGSKAGSRAVSWSSELAVQCVPGELW